MKKNLTVNKPVKQHCIIEISMIAIGLNFMFQCYFTSSHYCVKEYEKNFLRYFNIILYYKGANYLQ